ncbi:MAG: hypothetical protein ACJA0B_001258 [Alcanivorax borkumensis]|jgi:hypothetical protein
MSSALVYLVILGLTSFFSFSMMSGAERMSGRSVCGRISTCSGSFRKAKCDACHSPEPDRKNNNLSAGMPAEGFVE